MNKTEIVDHLSARLEEEFIKLSNQWNNPIGTKTRSFIIDNILPAEIAIKAYKSFPKNSEGFTRKDTFRERKSVSKNIDQYDKILSEIIYSIQDSKIIEIISKITGFIKIEPDPSLYAGGLSIMNKGDFLNPHLDNSHDSTRKKYRRLNVLLYVSPDWQIENGGNLELWDDKKIKPVTILSKFNRMVVMETDTKSWHSVSPIVKNTIRCCISNYYFSILPPSENEKKFHVTSFLGRPGESLKSYIGYIDNISRNIIAKIFKVGRGRIEK